MLYLVVMFSLIGCVSDSPDTAEKHPAHQLNESDFHAVHDAKFDAPCSPGENLGICRACDEDGRIRVQLRDDACGDLACETLDHFSLRREGDEIVCMAITYGVEGSACGVDGRCAREATVDICSVVEQRAVLRVVGPCSTIVGCDEEGDPVVQAAADGVACDGGECLSGQCAVADELAPPESVRPSARCGMFPATPFCGEGLDGVIPYCEFRVETPDFRSCEQVCADAGSWCLGAWDDERNTCAHQERQSCTARELDQVCRCAQPHIAEGDPFGE